MQPCFRMFAGPNGSGKTFLFTHLRSTGYIIDPFPNWFHDYFGTTD